MSWSRTATVDPALGAVVVAEVPLHYFDGADVVLDRPGHVRAGSSLAWVPGGIALVQDDANFVAVVEPDGLRTRAIPFPPAKAGGGSSTTGGGNRAHKLDLEACFSVEGEGGTVLVALGSGSTVRRESIVLIQGWERAEPDVTVIHVPRLYDALRREAAFAGSELNVEGAVFLGDRVRLFGRGNGAPRADVLPANATCDLDWPAFLAHLRAPDQSPPPEPAAIVRYELGAIDGVSLSFTDATVRGDAVLFTAAAEDSPDATLDGRVTGSAIGVIDAGGRARWTALTEPSGELFPGKAEGLLAWRQDDARLFVVVDTDEPDMPSALCTVELRGDWSR